MKWFLLILIAVILAAGFSLLIEEDVNTEARRCFELINAERNRIGIPSLAWDDRLEQTAIQWTEHMAETEVFEHSKNEFAENICMGFGNGNHLFELWRDSKGHYANMTSKDLHFGAVAIRQSKNIHWDIGLWISFVPIPLPSKKNYATFEGSR